MYVQRLSSKVLHTNMSAVGRPLTEFIDSKITITNLPQPAMGSPCNHITGINSAL